MTKEEKGGLAVIFWGPHTPSTEDYAQKLNAKMYKIHYLGWKRPWLAPLKYIFMWFKTWAILSKQKPDSVFVVNTPVFAPLCVFIYCRFNNIPYVMNIHGHSFVGWKWGWSKPLQRFLAIRAITNLVGFSEYKELFESWGAKAIILERPPISVDARALERIIAPENFVVTVISTFAPDEPLYLVIEAAELLPEVEFYILGNTKRADKNLLAAAPKNVIFPGYLIADHYWNQLYSSQAIMTLTTTPRSLVSGGVEAMAIGKPMILSRQPVLTDYFTKGAVFVEHTVESILEAVRSLEKNEIQMAAASRELAIQKRERWEKEFQHLVSLLESEKVGYHH